MKTPKLAIFDMDGLIFDTERLFMNKKNIVLKEYGYPAREEDYIQTIGLAGENLREMLIRLYGNDYPADEITSRTRALVNASIRENGPSVKPGIRLLLEWFAQQKVTCCVASSTSHLYVRDYLERAELDTCFSYIIGGDEIIRSKPAPDIFLKALRSVAPGDALVLEDSENGVRAAHAAGIPVVCIPDLKKPSDEIAGMASAVVRSADEVIPLFYQQ